MQNLIENLRYKFMQNSKLKYYVIIGVVIFILIIAIVLYMCLSKVDKTEPEIEDIPIDDFIEEEVVVEEKEVKQEETVNLLKAFIALTPVFLPIAISAHIKANPNVSARII